MPDGRGTRQRKPVAISDAAWSLLAYRTRSSEELRRRLLGKGYEAAAVSDEISRLQRLGYLDDVAFARALTDGRQRGSGARGSRAVRSELRARGVERGIIEASLRPEDDERLAAQVAMRKAVTLTGLPRAVFARRLGSFLQRRGFDLDTSRVAVAAAWARVDDDPVAIPNSTDVSADNC